MEKYTNILLELQRVNVEMNLLIHLVNDISLELLLNRLSHIFEQLYFDDAKNKEKIYTSCPNVIIIIWDDNLGNIEVIVLQITIFVII